MNTIAFLRTLIVCAVVAGLGSWVLVEWYERAYARVCERVRDRLR